MSGAPPHVRHLAPALRAALADAPRLAEVGADARAAAVLMLLAPVPASGTGDGADSVGVLLARRSDLLRSHPGQVALPGGRREAGDADAAATALREAGEEVALDPGGVDVLAELPAVGVLPSNHLVTPVLAWWRAPAPLVPDGTEVVDAAVVPLGALAAARVAVRYPWAAVGRGTGRGLRPDATAPTLPGYDVPGFFVWGFTAWLVTALLAAAGHDVSLAGARQVDAPVPRGGGPAPDPRGAPEGPGQVPARASRGTAA